jgi:NAD(P)-dependent dehydrogenase (short-subunit alcohol dehydrogenase family)
LLSNRSIAYGIAQACKREGAELAFTYVGERFKDRITEFAAEFDSKLIFECDVSSDEQIEALFRDLGRAGISLMVWYTPSALHRAKRLPVNSWTAFPRSFRIAHDISAYSFPALAKAALPMLRDKSALLTLSYLVRSVRFRITTPWVWQKHRWKHRYVISQKISAKKAYASTVSLLARSKRWQPAALKTSANCWASLLTTHHCAAM